MWALEPRSTEPKAQPNETEIHIKERIIEIRKNTRKCALKIHWQLEKEGVAIHTRTIGKILKKEKLVRKYRVKKIKYKYIRAERKPGELIEIDVNMYQGVLQTDDIFNIPLLIQHRDGDILRCMMSRHHTTQYCFLRK
jgi:hypothetical protein